MGYYIRIRNSKFSIPTENLPKFWEIVNHVMSDEQIAKHGNGGSYSQGQKSKHWYSWVDTESTRKAIRDQDLDKFFECWGYEFDGDGLYIITGESKIGDEEILFSAIAPVVEDNSFMEVVGEDDERWRWSWANGKFYVADAHEITYNNARVVDGYPNSW
jgi:hypothetical protein